MTDKKGETSLSLSLCPMLSLTNQQVRRGLPISPRLFQIMTQRKVFYRPVIFDSLDIF